MRGELVLTTLIAAFGFSIEYTQAGVIVLSKERRPVVVPVHYVSEEGLNTILIAYRH